MPALKLIKKDTQKTTANSTAAQEKAFRFFLDQTERRIQWAQGIQAQLKALADAFTPLPDGRELFKQYVAAEVWPLALQVLTPRSLEIA